MSNQFVLILDFGGQNNQLIARRVRDLGVYCEMHPYGMALSEITEKKPIGIILAGGAGDANAQDAPRADTGIFELGIPVLAIGYCARYIAKVFGGTVGQPESGEHALVEATLNTTSPLFRGLEEPISVWANRDGNISGLPQGFSGIASFAASGYAAICDDKRGFYGLAFQPEVKHTEKGAEILRNFLFGVCGATGDWSMEDYASAAIKSIRDRVGDKKVLLALSGGVDSTVCAALLSKAIGGALTCIFVDTGLMRKNEGNEVEEAFRGWDINLIRVNGEERFLNKLAGVSDPETKRKIIGEEFIRVFEEEAKKAGSVDFLAQGTIYSDVIESGVGDAKVVKSHHNVGGLPEHMDFKGIVEPLWPLFKDEVRQLGAALGLPDYMVSRQPFPGPGLSIRVIGDVTKEKLDLLREADYIFRDEIAQAGIDKEINQYFAILTNMRSVGVRGEERSYEHAIALRGIVSEDLMTAEWAKIPYSVLEKVSRRIVSELCSVNRVVYDITSKPPATIEWE